MQRNADLHEARGDANAGGSPQKTSMDEEVDGECCARVGERPQHFLDGTECDIYMKQG